MQVFTVPIEVDNIDLQRLRDLENWLNGFSAARGQMPPGMSNLDRLVEKLNLAFQRAAEDQRAAEQEAAAKKTAHRG